MLIDGRGRRYMIVLQSKKQFHSHLGVVEHDSLIGSEEGSDARASSGARMKVFRPTLADYALKMKRGAQVIYPKDVGLILVYADIGPGATVVEAGTGSGALTIALARAVGDSGRVISYEVREDHHANAVENITAWYESFGGKPENLELRLADVFTEPPELPIDRLVLDLPEPWRAIGTAADAVVSGGIVCCYLPTVPQVSQTVEALRGGGFGLINTFEGLVRTWNVEGQSVRPDHRMVAHTGFLVTARKLVT